ncbi:MAG: thiamine phosphate synthase [Acidobacteriota bacterium]
MRRRTLPLGMTTDPLKDPGPAATGGSRHLAHRLRLMVLTGQEMSRGRACQAVVRQALRGGATAIQVREKDLGDGALLELVDSLRLLTRRSEALLLVNDRPDIAVLAGADGCHLGPKDLTPSQARKVCPRPAIVGFSTRDPRQAAAAAAAGADYLGVGPVFSTQGKADAGPPLGLARLAEIAAASSLPVVAIGGIGAETAAACIEAGACGVAVLSSVTGAASVAPAARALRRAVEGALHRQRPEGGKGGAP